MVAVTPILPADPRLSGIVELMMSSPFDRSTLLEWSRRARMGARTTERLIRRKTVFNFGRWRQQLSVILAVNGLAERVSIQPAACNFGYESVPSFVTMFRKTLGTPPGRYMPERYAGGAGHGSAPG